MALSKILVELTALVAILALVAAPSCNLLVLTDAFASLALVTALSLNSVVVTAPSAIPGLG